MPKDSTSPDHARSPPSDHTYVYMRIHIRALPAESADALLSVLGELPFADINRPGLEPFFCSQPDGKDGTQWTSYEYMESQNRELNSIAA
jgi:hypothetical protein